MDLKLMAVREDLANILMERFRQTPERTYSEIMSVLLAEGPTESHKK